MTPDWIDPVKDHAAEGAPRPFDWRDFLDRVAAGLGLSYEQLTADWRGESGTSCGQKSDGRSDDESDGHLRDSSPDTKTAGKPT